MNRAPLSRRRLGVAHVDVYRLQQTSTTVTQGEKRFLNRPPIRNTNLGLRVARTL